ncbi:hypothetical protein WA026_002656 [Henosepilachna vigintioctopunctata]|uniref:Uncharacterized protein n=1 Tax=Henosepilachna vigintioctopunctata TaxID=420089 RepID=A0AAW1U4L9_9CUCU
MEVRQPIGQGGSSFSIQVLQELQKNEYGETAKKQRFDSRHCSEREPTKLQGCNIPAFISRLKRVLIRGRSELQGTLATSHLVGYEIIREGMLRLEQAGTNNYEKEYESLSSELKVLEINNWLPEKYVRYDEQEIEVLCARFRLNANKIKNSFRDPGKQHYDSEGLKPSDKPHKAYSLQFSRV